MPVEYDSDILQAYANDLYKQARYIVITTAIRYTLITFLISIFLCGGLFAYLAQEYRGTDYGPWAIVCVLILTLVGTAAGISEGRRKAFELKLRAQEVLCQRQIELNTNHLNVEHRVAVSN